MGLKILHSADWHLDSPFASFSAEQREFLRSSQQSIPDRMASLCHGERCDMVLLAGDIFDGVPTRETVLKLKQALAECAVPVFISPGNHDHCGLGSVWQEEVWPENVTVFTGGMESVSIPHLNCRVYGAGYQTMDCPPLLEGFRAEGRERYCIAVLHADPVGVHSPYCPVTAGQIRESGLDYLALGHIHKGGSLICGDTLCLWPGCPMGRGWDETGEKGAVVVTLGQEPQTRFIPLGLPRFYDMEADAPRLLADMLPAQANSDFYRITLTGESGADMGEIQKNLSRFPNLILRDRRMPETDLWSDVGEDSLRGVYFRILQERSRTDPAAVLAAELSQKILSEREVVLP